MECVERIVKKHAGLSAVLGVAVSGGPDSMCLLSALLEFYPREKLVVLNLDHGLRGKESERDSAFVKDFAQKQGLRLVAEKVSVPDRMKSSGRGEELEARLARREFFEEALSDGGVDFVLTAHNAGDRTESVLLHLLRGSDVRGLVGPTERDGRFLRPLIGVTRAEIEEYNSRHNVPFVLDSTNADTRYSRNFLRREVLPLLNERFSVDRALCRLSASAARDEEFIRSALEPEKYITESGGRVSLALEALSLPAALSTRLVAECAMRAGKRTDLESKHVFAALALRDKENGKRADLGGGYTAAREYDRITFYRAGGEPLPEPEPFAIGLTPFGNGLISISPCEAAPMKGRLRIDGDRVPEGAEIRVRRAGDRFTPFGGGERKLKEFFIDRKIPLGNRDKIPLLCYNDRVLAVFGVEISRELRLTERTVNALELTFTEDEV